MTDVHVVYPGQQIELVADGEILPFKVFNPSVDKLKTTETPL